MNDGVETSGGTAVPGGEPEARPPDELVRHAEAAARLAGVYALTNQARRREVFTRSHHDVKLHLDLETQDVVEKYIRGFYPQHDILGEEGEFRELGDGYTWVIDPIDGTVNYSHGLPHWCTAVAVFRGQDVVAGAVYAPVRDECYTATIEGPALCNGEPIAVSPVDSVMECIVLSGSIGRAIVGDERRWRTFKYLAASVSKVRVLGAAALDCCYVACGRADAMFEYDLNIWDVAAAGLIASRAGAQIRRFEEKGQGVGTYLIAGKGIFGSLWSQLSS